MNLTELIYNFEKAISLVKVDKRTEAKKLVSCMQGSRFWDNVLEDFDQTMKETLIKDIENQVKNFKRILNQRYN